MKYLLLFSVRIENRTLGIGKSFTWDGKFDDFFIEEEEIDGKPLIFQKSVFFLFKIIFS